MKSKEMRLGLNESQVATSPCYYLKWACLATALLLVSTVAALNFLNPGCPDYTITYIDLDYFMGVWYEMFHSQPHSPGRGVSQVSENSLCGMIDFQAGTKNYFRVQQSYMSKDRL
eukprot:CAMPEP_0168618688 /NCGR_PEP_ID=MMETSP0449_2-20121227/6204_1 /TAXON_ID=1082188 /ORGANISM="Strombidium rassoulzadegani, Strain ras09" /LENGTH=114 /DNA_ID=CAMNT_0008659577 /DNA_START=13 /DNA_END=357 /DNA_ORIENTATION=-